MADKVIEILDGVSVHDAPLSGFAFDFDKKTIGIALELYDDLENRYVPLKVKLSGVSSFLSEYDTDAAFNPQGCLNVRYSRKNDKQYETVWVFDMDVPNVWAVTIVFEDVEVTGGLSPEAQAHRDAYFEGIYKENSEE